MWFDPMYFVFLAPGILLALWAQYRVRSAYSEASGVPVHSGYSGAETADVMLRSHGIEGVRIEPVGGVLSDHYDPREKVLRLSPDVYAGRSLAALGIAAHEAGHAVQDASRYPLLVLRNGLVPLASVGSGAAWIIIFLGLAMHLMGLILAGIVVFSAVVLFQLVNLPVEYDASRRARVALVESGLVTPEEEVEVGRVLNAAALTYVAATLTSVLTLLYFLFRLVWCGAQPAATGLRAGLRFGAASPSAASQPCQRTDWRKNASGLSYTTLRITSSPWPRRRISRIISGTASGSDLPQSPAEFAMMRSVPTISRMSTARAGVHFVVG
jgi:Zn-dependent membrane protease YugP